MRRDQLDGLRALCFLAVFFHHNQGPGPHSPHGYAAVYVFFALSGFLVTGILDRISRWSMSGYLDFMARRALRICPIYYATLALLALAGELSHPGWYVSYAGNARIIMDRRWPSLPLTIFWTLAVEFQFYLVYPVAFLLTPRRLRLALILVLIAGSKWARFAGGGGPAGPWSLLSTPVCAEYLLWGSAIALVPPTKSARLAGWSAAGGFAMLAVWTWFATAGDGAEAKFSGENWFMAGGGTVDGIGSALLVYGIWCNRGWLTRSLSWPPLAYLGLISYGLYVYHPLTLGLLYRHIGDLPGLWRVHWAVALLLTVAAASLSWHFFERPILGLKKYLPGRTRPGPDRGEATSRREPVMGGSGLAS